MKLQLNKKKLKNLSKDAQLLPSDVTPQIGAGAFTDWAGCTSNLEETFHGCNSDQFCNNSGFDDCDYSYLCRHSDKCVSGFC